MLHVLFVFLQSIYQSENALNEIQFITSIKIVTCFGTSVPSSGGLPEHKNTSRVQLERDGTRAETRFGLPAKRTSPFISAGVSVQSSTGFLGVRVGRERL